MLIIIGCFALSVLFCTLMELSDSTSFVGEVVEGLCGLACLGFSFLFAVGIVNLIGPTTTNDLQMLFLGWMGPIILTIATMVIAFNLSCAIKNLKFSIFKNA